MEPSLIENPGHLAQRPLRKRGANPNARTGLIMVAPVVLLVALFTLYPFGRAIYQSTRVESPIFPSRYVGLGNYRYVLQSDLFMTAAKNTLLFAAVTVPILLVLGILVAMLLNERFFGNTALRIGMLLPWAIPATVSGLIWKWVFLDSWGALNAGLYSLGIIDSYMDWLTTPNLAKMVVVLVFVWSQLPLTAIFILAARQGISEDLFEAAELDGAGPIGRFWSVTLPGIRPMLIVVALFDLLMAITNFDITYSLTQGGPGTATTMLTYFTWAESFKMLDFGRGSALAILIALGSFAAILVLVRAMPTDALMEERR